MKKIHVTLLLALALASGFGLVARADLIKVEPGFGPFQFGSGGEFTVLRAGTVPSGYVGATRDFVELNSFQTFCVEMHENINAGTYEVTVGQVTRESGVTLTKGVAWLYDQFRNGFLSTYDYTPVTRKFTAFHLQEEFWHLMSQGPAADPIFDPIVNAAAILGGWGVNDPSMGFLNVEVLSLWLPGQVGTRQGARQDVLFIPTGSNIPDSSSALMLFGFGLTCLFVVKRGSQMG